MSIDHDLPAEALGQPPQTPPSNEVILHLAELVEQAASEAVVPLTTLHTGEQPPLAKPISEAPKEALSRRTLLVGSGVVAAGLLGLGALFSSRGRASAPKVDSSPENSSAATASATAPNKTATAELPTIQKVEIEDTELWKGLSEARQKEWMRLATISDKDFMKLPDEQRARFSEFTYRLVEPYVTAMLKEFDPNYEPVAKASIDDSNDKILRGIDTRLTTAYLMDTKNGDPATFRDPSIINGDNWAFIAKRYSMGLYASDNPEIDTVRGFLDGTANPGLDLPKMCDGGCYYGMKATSDEIVGFGPNRTIKFTATWSDIPEIQGHYQLVTFTPFDNKPGDSAKTSIWQTGALIG